MGCKIIEKRKKGGDLKGCLALHASLAISRIRNVYIMCNNNAAHARLSRFSVPTMSPKKFWCVNG